MATQAKIDQVAELTQKIKNSKSIVLVDYQGITVNEETELRKKVREAGAEYLVAKNRLFKIALKEAGVQDSFDDLLEGTTAFAFGYDDPVAPAKFVYDLAKDKAKAKQEVFKIKGGLLDGNRVEMSEVEALAKLPSREQLLSMLLNSMLGPIRKLAYATVAIADKKAAAEAQAE
ncbi:MULTISPECIES: 50S ribosomal protein L10 [Fusobacterium]|uniref:Large ribosomal subunit protein uL10 n=1 Tax=Fusobacterium hominis TaxID=2764326 RepID=A0A7G9GV97_9FUSO|nr:MULTISPECIES: 50S ribosomal protein L10 [Fusobacterium]QNM14729.1 50S ribosomal protein L10 [Fusobacterium hominis]